jgi:hypothetical protein
MHVCQMKFKSNKKRLKNSITTGRLSSGLNLVVEYGINLKTGLEFQLLGYYMVD